MKIRSIMSMTLIMVIPLISLASEQGKEIDQLFEDALSYWKKGDNDRAIKFLDQVLARDPEHKDALFYKGHIAVKMGKTDDAFDCWDKLTQIEPINAFNWYNRAFPLALLNKYTEAEKATVRLNNLHRKTPECLSQAVSSTLL